MYCLVWYMLILSKQLLKALASRCLLVLIFEKNKTKTKKQTVLKYVNQIIIKDPDKVPFQESSQCPINF